MGAKFNKKKNQGSDSLQEQIIKLEKQLESFKHSNDHFLKNKLFLHYDIKEPEKVVVDCETKLPVLAEVDKKKILKGKDSDPTHLIIEGDNYHALSVLNYTHAGKVDVIYIDPPYNTGNKDFIYNDRFVDKEDSFRHSKWLSFMAHRLRLAKNLLTETGVIFISIDDNEQAHLRLLCDQIFGEENFVGDIIWNSTKSVTNTALISVSHTYNLVYAKKIDYWIKNRTKFRIADTEEGFENPDNDSRGPWKADPFQVGGWRPNQQYEITNPNTGKIYKPNRGSSWKNDFDKFQKLLAENRIVFGRNGTGGPQRKRFLSEALDRGRVVKTIWDDVGTTTNGTQLLKQILGDGVDFNNPKPVDFLKKIVDLATGKDEPAIILDFFAGSGTTGHAVLKLNARDGGSRQFILCSTNDEKEPIVDKVLYPRIKKVIDGYGKTAGLPANLRYFQTDFVEKGKNSDQTRTNLVVRAVAMINVREATYEKVEMKKGYVLSQSATTFTAIIFDSFKLEDIWKVIEKKNKGKLPVKLYIFSFSDDTSAFTDMIPKTTKLDWESKSIPEGILQVYQRLFKKKET